ncbi:MAG: flagellar basal body rod protein FlgC [Pseudomonadota bacterium]
MTDFQKAAAAAASGMRAQSARMRIASENLANADSTGYRRKTVAFTDELDRTSGARTVAIDRIDTDNAPLNQRYDPSHPLADGQGYVTGSNVNMLMEVADARESQRSYRANLSIFDQTRQIYGEILGLLRR